MQYMSKGSHFINKMNACGDLFVPTLLIRVQRTVNLEIDYYEAEVMVGTSVMRIQFKELEIEDPIVDLEEEMDLLALNV